AHGAPPTAAPGAGAREGPRPPRRQRGGTLAGGEGEAGRRGQPRDETFQQASSQFGTSRWALGRKRGRRWRRPARVTDQVVPLGGRMLARDGSWSGCRSDPRADRSNLHVTAPPPGLGGFFWAGQWEPPG